MRIEQFGIWVNEMDRIPAGYGVAWLSIWSGRAFCMRVPFHRLVGSFRAFYIEFQRPCEDDPVLAAFIRGKNEGFRHGNAHGYWQGFAAGDLAARDAMKGKAWKA